MKTRIGFSTPKKFNPVSWLVRKISGSNASRAFFIYFDRDWESEAVVIALQKSNYPGAEKLEARDTTPQDLLEFFTKEGPPSADA